MFGGVVLTSRYMLALVEKVRVEGSEEGRGGLLLHGEVHRSWAFSAPSARVPSARLRY